MWRRNFYRLLLSFPWFPSLWSFILWEILMEKIVGIGERWGGWELYLKGDYYYYYYFHSRLGVQLLELSGPICIINCLISSNTKKVLDRTWYDTRNKFWTWYFVSTPLVVVNPLCSVHLFWKKKGFFWWAHPVFLSLLASPFSTTKKKSQLWIGLLPPSSTPPLPPSPRSLYFGWQRLNFIRLLVPEIIISIIIAPFGY